MTDIDPLLDLIVRARTNDARAAWEALRIPSPTLAEVLEIHVPVASLLLHRAQLDFAELVLNDVPTTIDHHWVMALRQHLTTLRMAEANLEGHGPPAPLVDVDALPPLPVDPVKYLRAAGWIRND